MSTPGHDAAIGALAISTSITSGNAAVPQQDSGIDGAELRIASAGRTEIVFIEDNVADYQTIASHVGAGREVVILDAHADGLQQIVAALAGRSGIDALHIVSHGSAGALNFGALTLNRATLAEHQAELEAIGRSMAPGGDILLYGCDTGADAGFVDALAIATGADVAASSDATGSTALGGDWDLEITSGGIETDAIGGAGLASAYQQTLALPSTVSINFNTAANFSGQNTADLYYRVNNDSAYQLHIQSSATAYYRDWGYTPDITIYSPSGSANISFKDGQLFNLSSLLMRGSNNSAMTFTGYDKDGHFVATQTFALGLPLVKNFTGFTNIAVLTITSGDAYPFDYFEFDDLVLTNVHTAVVDNTPPATPPAPVFASGSDTGRSAADGITKLGKPTFSGSAEAGATVRLYDTDKTTLLGSIVADGSGNWSITPTNPMSSGAHAVSVTATDAANNTSGFSGTLAVTIDTAAPGRPDAPLLEIASDSGAPGDGITNDATPTVSGTAEADAVVTLYDSNGSTVLGSVTADVNGRWSITSSALADGTHTLTVTATDVAGNVSAVSNPLGLTIDTTLPAAPLELDLLAASDTGMADDDDITGNTTPTFTGRAESGATVRLYDGGTEIGSVTAANGRWTIVSSALDAGSHVITAVATDAAGNTGAASAPLTVEIITDAPATSVSSIDIPQGSSIADGGHLTRVAAQTVSGTLSAALAAGERVQVSVDGGQHWSDASAAVGDDHWSAAATLAEGSHQLKVRVVNAVDNSGPVASQAYTLDTVAPTVLVTSNTSQLKAGESATITFTFSEDPGTSFTSASIAVSGGVLGELSGSGLTRSASFTPAAGVDNGTASIAVSAGAWQDAAGNAGAAGTTPFLSYDTLAPGAPAAPVLDSASDSGLAGDGVTSVATPTVHGSAAPFAAVTLYGNDGVTVLGTANAGAQGGWTITSSALADGTHNLRAVQRDAAGNASAPGAALTVVIDRSAAAPAAPLLAAASDSGVAGDGITRVRTPVVTGSAEALAQVTLYDSDGQTVLGAAQAGADGKWSITSTALADGVHALTVKQVDVAGNVSAASQALALTIDTVAPAAPGVPGLSAASDSGVAGDGITNRTPVLQGVALANALVTVYDGQTALGTARADAQGNWSLEVTGLALGAHAISATQSDAAGNVSGASGSFALTLRPPFVRVDGVNVETAPVVLPGGAAGTQVQVPIVGAGRVDTGGQASTADIPLATAGGVDLLVAQVGEGFGLSATGGDSTAVAAEAGSLGAAIRAATLSNSASDQTQLTDNAANFLARLPASDALLVRTIAPVSQSAPDSALVLSGGGDAQQHVALVIQTADLARGSAIALQNVDFAAVVGAADVTADGGTRMLSGDAAGQRFTVSTSGGTQVFAGGGSDTLVFGAPAAPNPNGAIRAQLAPAAVTTMLHGGAGTDIAVFNGARADFDVEVHNGYLLVASHGAPAAKAMVVNAEGLQFSDVLIAVQNKAEMATLAGIYQSALGRQADVMGIAFWADRVQDGVSWGEVVVNIVGSAEGAAGHGGFNGRAAHDVALLYTALFERAPDAAGLDFWTGAMARGATLSQVAEAFVQSAEMIGHQRAATDWDFSV